jgi:(heptosyl)LPS beta-1,4-glucosyltransferase
MPKLTVLIPCKDERQHIAGCIESVRTIADEVLIADSGSTDGTLDVVNSLGGCRVEHREHVNAADFRNWALERARHEWVLVLHADERLTPELAAEVRTLLASPPPCDGYSLTRENYFLGYPIRHGGFGQPRLVRLMRRTRASYRMRHDRAEAVVAGGHVGRLQHPLLHYAALDLDRFLARQQRHATWAALDAYDAGKRATWLKMATHAPLRFLQLYILRGGFLDRRAGLMLCGLLAYFTFLRDCKLWELNHSRARHDPPRRRVRQIHLARPSEAAREVA